MDPGTPDGRRKAPRRQRLRMVQALRALLDKADGGDDEALMQASRLWVRLAAPAELLALPAHAAHQPFAASVIPEAAAAARAGKEKAAELCRKLRGLPAFARIIDAAEARAQ